ncbi:MAG: 3-hydroxyacyl-CoA dehydrogenase family protein, partial [Pseudomonadota bacterium]|nr:3-hydroxyacyl-CoA dehydrogenase family protein [Pseudomonadota bacterium]
MTATNSNRKVAVAGAGLMGCGIASMFALAGFDVVVYDSHASALSHTKQNCHAVFLEMAVANLIAQSELAAAEARVRTAESLAELSEAALVIEAIVESVSAKQSLYCGLEAVLSDAAILASSTSGIVPETLSEHLRRPGRFLVAHFWNPPHIIPLVEVVPAPRTEQSTVVATMEWLTAANCKPVLLSKAVPGFIGNRLQFAVLREALHMLQTGIADADTI